MDFNQFAETVKEAHPEYKDRDNLTLAKAIVEKHPEYADRVTFDVPKKAEDTSAPAKPWEIEKQPGLPKSPMDLVKQVGRQFVEGATSPMPGSLLSVPFKAVSENASQAGADVARGTEHALGKGLARTAGLVTSAALDPTSYMGGELAKGPALAKSTPLSEMKPNVEDMINNLKDQSSTLKSQIETHTQSVMNHVDDVLKKYGGELNDAKAKIGIPTTNAEREASLVKNGNPHGLGVNNLSKENRALIASPKNATELAQNVAKFKDKIASIPDDTTRIRMASVLQDHINSLVDWTKSGNTTEGVLKSQYQDLKRIGIPAELKASKSKMAEVLDLTGDLQKKMDEPGKAEAFLRNIVTGKSARNKDSLMALRHLEELSGQPFFDKIANAVKTEKAADLSIKHLEKMKPEELKAITDTGIKPEDLLHFATSGWSSVVKAIVSSTEQIGPMLKKAGKAVGVQVPIAASRGFAMSDDNKAKLDVVMQRLKRAK